MESGISHLASGKIWLLVWHVNDTLCERLRQQPKKAEVGERDRRKEKVGERDSFMNWPNNEQIQMF